MANIFAASIEDDVTAKSKAMAASVDQLASRIGVLGTAFKKTQTQSLNVGLKEAKRLLKESAGNMTLWRMAMKAAGASALDTSLMAAKFNAELREQRKTALGLNGIFNKIFSPKAIWVASHAMNVLSHSYNLFKETAGKAISFGMDKGGDLISSVIDAAQERQNTIVALKESFKGTEKERTAVAEDLYKYFVKAAVMTPLDTDYMVERGKGLAEQGYKPEEVKTLTAMIADVQTKMGGDHGALLGAAFERMAARGTVGRRDFNSLIAARAANMDQVSLNMAKTMGIHGKDTDDIKAKVLKQLSKGGTSKYVMLNALKKTMEDQNDRGDGNGGRVGAFAMKNSETLTGALSNFRNAFGDMLKLDDVTKWKGISTLADFLVRVQTEMTNTEGAGGRLLKRIEEFIDATVGGFDKISDAQIDYVIDQVGNALHWAADKAKELWAWFDRITDSKKSMGDVGTEILKSLEGTLVDIGKLIGKGIRAGIMDIDWKQLNIFSPSSDKMRAEASGAFGGQFGANAMDIKGRAGVGDMRFGVAELLDKFTDSDVLGVKSAMSAAMSPEDMANAAGSPHMADGGIVRRPTYALIGEAGPEAVVPLGKGGLGHHVGEMNFHFSGDSIGGHSPDDVSRAILKLGVREVTQLFESLAKSG